MGALWKHGSDFRIIAIQVKLWDDRVQDYGCVLPQPVTAIEDPALRAAAPMISCLHACLTAGRAGDVVVPDIHGTYPATLWR